MASNFWNGDFYFDGIHSSQYKVCLVDIGNKDIFKEYGVDFNISLDKEISYNGNPYYIESERTASDITIELCRVDNKPWTPAELLNVQKWLFKKNFKRFQSTDFNREQYNIVYYLKAISLKKYLTPDLYGYLEVTFAPYDAYGFIIPNDTFIISGSGNKTLQNYSNIGINYLPKIKVKNLGLDSGVIRIKNATTQQESLNIKGINNNETIIIDCKMATVLNTTNENRFEVLQNYNFIELAEGKNVITVTGNATVEFICEYPIII